jgi:hypothetical protein
MNPFEEKLSRLRLAEPPRDLRRRVLAAAAASAPERCAGLFSGWREYFWPHPTAWGALAAVWVVIFMLQWASPSSESLMAHADGTLPDSWDARQYLEYVLLRDQILRAIENDYLLMPKSPQVIPKNTL